MTIARALVNDPAIVWADEPTGDLDSAERRGDHRAAAPAQRERGLSLLIVTHDLAVGRGDRPHHPDGDGVIVRRRAGRAPRPALAARRALMRALFGIPMDELALGLSLALGLVLALVAVLALRNRVLLRLGLRNAARRPGRAR